MCCPAFDSLPLLSTRLHLESMCSINNLQPLTNQLKGKLSYVEDELCQDMETSFFSSLNFFENTPSYYIVIVYYFYRYVIGSLQWHLPLYLVVCSPKCGEFIALLFTIEQNEK